MNDNPILALEQRPSAITGIAFWLVLAYKSHHFEQLLPDGFMGWDEEARDLCIARAGEELRRQLAPILIAEDCETRLVLS